MPLKENTAIIVYPTFEDMDEARTRRAASCDPVKGLAETVELILRVYGVSRQDLKKRFQKNTITILRTK